MFIRKPFVATLEEVVITRKKRHVTVTYKEQESEGLTFKVGAKAATMTDEEILELHNDTVERMQAMKEKYDYVAEEIPEGRAQIEWCKRGEQWLMKGDVLKFVISCPDDARTPVVQIDGKELTWVEFGEMISTNEGFGVRLIVVPDDEIHQKAQVKLRGKAPKKVFREEKSEWEFGGMPLVDLVNPKEANH